MSIASKLLVAVWGERPETKAERRLLVKIDTVILSYSCISFFFNYLDRAALGNAYVSGMREEIGLVGNQYNVLNTCLTVGYIVGQVPHGLAIQKIPPRIWFSSMVIIWGGLTMCCAAATKFEHLAAIRFIQGAVEASTYSGTQYIIGSWYKPAEIGKRTGLFAASGMAGTMFSGIMMTAIHSTMGGVAGLTGWRWLFIILGIITMPVGVFGFIMFPDLPTTTKAFWLSPEEKLLAVSRLPPRPPNAEGHKLGWSLFRRVFARRESWVLIGFWVIGGALESFSINTCMLIWMGSLPRFSVPQRNTYPLGITAIGIFMTLSTAIAIDATRRHMPWGFTACVLQVIACAILVVPVLADGAVFAGFYIAGTAYMIQPVCFTWANKILLQTGDDAARAIILYAMNGASSILFSFWGIILYPATDAPNRFRKGTIAMFATAAVLAGWIVLTWHTEKFVLRRAARAREEAEELEVDKVDAGVSGEADVGKGEKAGAELQDLPATSSRV